MSTDAGKPRSRGKKSSDLTKGTSTMDVETDSSQVKEQEDKKTGPEMIMGDGKVPGGGMGNKSIPPPPKGIVPKILVRVTPGVEEGSSILESVGPEGNELRIFSERNKKNTSITFKSDGVILSPKQDEVFVQSGVAEVVEQAMSGLSSAVICAGSDGSGKNYTLFGPRTKFQLRGVIPRALEKVFELMEAKKDICEYRVILSMYEIHKDRIKDLLTLGPYELHKVGEYGPMGLFYEEVSSVEHGLCLLFRGLEGQAILHPEPYVKPHTIIYIDILGKSKGSKSDAEEEAEAAEEETEEPSEWRSRITFVKLASIIPLPEAHQEADNSKSKAKASQFQTNAGCCCKPCGGPSGKLAQAISVRKDMYYLEQMFVKSHQQHKIAQYYHKLASIGMHVLVKPPKLAPSEYVRVSKLTNCLRDLTSGTNATRVLLHLKPVQSAISSTMESLRFAARVKCTMPCSFGTEGGGAGEDDEKAALNKLLKDLGLPKPGAEFGEQGMLLHEIMRQTSAFFDTQLDSLEATCKDQVKQLFKAFQETLMHSLEQKERRMGSLGSSNDPSSSRGSNDDKKRKSSSPSAGTKGHPIPTASDHGGKKTSFYPGTSRAKSRRQMQRKAQIAAANKDVDEDDDDDEGKRFARAVKKSTSLPAIVGGKLNRSRSVMAIDSLHNLHETFDNLSVSSSNDSDAALSVYFPAFIQADAELFKSFNERKESLHQSFVQHDQLQIDLATIMKTRTELEVQLDAAREARKARRLSKPDSEEEGVLKEIQENAEKEAETLQKLKELRTQILEQKEKLQEEKEQVEMKFAKFCHEKYGNVPTESFKFLPLSTLERPAYVVLSRWSRVREDGGGGGGEGGENWLAKLQELDEMFEKRKDEKMNEQDLELLSLPENEREFAKKFENVKKIAKEQAAMLLQTYPKRPRWKIYC